MAARDEPGRDPIARERGVFMISVAAELAQMHPQTLRMYEARGLIAPRRSAKNTRLYSQADVERLRRIQRMTTSEGLNLAGVETVLRLEERLEQMRAELAQMRQNAERMEREMLEEMERLARAAHAELVPYGAYKPDFGDGGRRARAAAPEQPAGIRVEIKRRTAGG